MTNFYITFLYSGMLIMSSVPHILGLGEDISYNNYYRYGVVIFSLYFIIKNIVNRNINDIPKKYIVLFLFLAIYFLRLLYDLYIADITLFFDSVNNSYRDPVYYLYQIFGIVILPILGILSIDKKNINPSIILNSIYFIMLFILLYSLIYRNVYDFNIRDSGLLKMSVLLYGHYGASLIILSFYKLSLNNYDLFKKIIYFLSIIIGFVIIFVSGSRSPLIAVSFSLIYFYTLKYNFLKLSILFSIIFILFYNFFVDFLILIESYFPNTFLERVLWGIENYDLIEGRNFLFLTGIDEFLSNPILGNAFLLTSQQVQGSYPHNLILESFMATGIFGGILFLILNYKIIQYSTKLVNDIHYGWVSILFFQYFIFSFFSGNLFSSSMYWISTALVLNLINIKKQ